MESTRVVDECLPATASCRTFVICRTVSEHTSRSYGLALDLGADMVEAGDLVREDFLRD